MHRKRKERRRFRRRSFHARKSSSDDMSLGLDQPADIAELEGEVFPARVRLGRHDGRMIGHQQIFISDFAIDLERLDEIDVAIVGKYFGDEVVAAALDVAEM